MDNDYFPETFTLHWGKIRAARAHLTPGSPLRWFVFTDADLLIMDMSVELHRLADPAYDLIITQEDAMSSVNTGVWMMQNTAWSRRFLEKVHRGGRALCCGNV